MVAYITLTVWLLSAAGLWDTGHLKNTLVWSVTVAAVLLFRVASRSKETNFLRQFVRDNLQLIVLVEFVVSFYTFGMIGELILLPVMGFLGGALVVAESDKKHEEAVRVLNVILSGIGILLIVRALYGLLYDFGTFSTQDTLADFSLPPVLSFLFLPFLYGVALVLDYERAFLKVLLFIEDSDLRRYAKRNAILGFHLNTKLADRWAKRLAYTRPASREDVDESIRQVFAMLRIEKNPPEVDRSLGWPPYASKDYLANQGFNTGYYQSAFGNDWHASSSYKELEGGILPNNIAYYVDGNSKAATALRLFMNVNESEHSGKAHTALLENARSLSGKAIETPLPDDVERAISEGRNISIGIERYRIVVRKDQWPAHERNGYSVEFTIRMDETGQDEGEVHLMRIEPGSRH